ncbi:peptidoglycan D,D-transpeptidase FtsI family protein [Sporosarcina jiandibaonis]|uniref:peptidoglycan D,D-transpeptidase FtsI family protein n=1 Tax=Sporosarcina jiandibaonis TaxID=2715535 RepID=UPI003CCE3DF3
MNLLFLSIFILFSILILRLGYLQIVKSEEYVMALERKEEVSVNTSVPRGRIFDRDGRILVDNEPKNAITYTKTSSTTTQEMLDIAEKLALLIEQDTNRTTIGDKRDFWILNNKEEAAKKVTEKEIAKLEGDASEIQREINRLTRERVTDEELNSFSKHELEVLAIYREMMSGYAFSPQIIKSGDVTEEEFAAVSERLGELPGVNTTTDWERVRKSYNTILGTTTTPDQGIPSEQLEYYLTRGYSRNDRVGKSFIEQYYEELLQGQKTVVKNVKDRTGKVIETKTVQEGIPGKDLILTIDSELNSALEDIVSEKLLELKNGPNSQALNEAYLVMMNPKTGEILSLVGKRVARNKDTGKYEIRDYSFGTFSGAYMAGSTVKMATLLTGYQEGGARIGETKIDEGIKIANDNMKSSVFNRSYNRIPMNDIEAIGRSSNVYMWKTAIGIGNGTYQRGKSLSLKSTTFDIMKNSFESFGLGSLTGVDLPGEVSGYSSRADLSDILDYSIGQFATYTPLQLAQYVSTIANDGYRVAPKILKEVREPSPDGEIFGRVAEETPVKVLNRIKNTDEEIDRIKKGMYYTYYGPRGTARTLFKDADFKAAGKTGTAQSSASVPNPNDPTKYIFYPNTINLSHVGYAPFDDPEIAYAVLIPNVSTNPGKYTQAQNDIVEAAVMKYFELKEKKEKDAEFDDVFKIKKPFNKDDILGEDDEKTDE